MTTDRSNPVPVPQRRGYQSIFFKLFTVLLGAIVITYLAFGGFYASFWNATANGEAHKNLIHYGDLLSREIGSPPDTMVAARLSQQLGRAIAITGPYLNWRSKNFSDYVWNQVQSTLQETNNATSDQLPDQLHTRVSRDMNGVKSTLPDSVNIILHEGHIWTAIDKGDYVFMFGTRQRQPGDAMGRDWVALITVLFLAWLLAWITLHRMLKPLRRLEAGVVAVRTGDLNVRLPEQGNDELSELARSFNAMTDSLRERLRARDQLLLDVSHELRSPLTRMRVALEMAIPGMAVDSLRDEVGALEQMVAELLETERLNSTTGGLKLQPTNLAKIIVEKISRVEGQSPGAVWKGGEVPSLPLDAERMKLVLRNLLDNALKYGRTASRPVEISLRKEGNFAMVEIQDFGPGIPPEEQRLVFEPFYRVDRSRSMSPGYGLGLSLCKRIVEMHGGNISLASRVGEGTKVTIKLPLNP